MKKEQKALELLKKNGSFTGAFFPTKEEIPRLGTLPDLITRLNEYAGYDVIQRRDPIIGRICRSIKEETQAHAKALSDSRSGQIRILRRGERLPDVEEGPIIQGENSKDRRHEWQESGEHHTEELREMRETFRRSGHQSLGREGGEEMGELASQ